MGADIPSILDRGLLVIVRPIRGNPTETPAVRALVSPIGRFPVDVDFDPAVDR